MKLLIITCLKEYCNAVTGIFEQAAIRVFSMTDVVGKKDGEPASLIDNWFSSGKEEYDSAFIFSFTGYENARKAMTLINEYNEAEAPEFPIRVFILPVEMSNL